MPPPLSWNAPRPSSPRPHAKVAFRTKQFDRIRQLHERGAVEKRLVQETESQLRAAEADQRAAQAIVSAAQTSLKAAEEPASRGPDRQATP